MPLLSNLTVKKVSFVRNAANKRKFLLLKSTNVEGKDNINNNGGTNVGDTKDTKDVKKTQDPTKEPAKKDATPPVKDPDVKKTAGAVKPAPPVAAAGDTKKDGDVMSPVVKELVDGFKQQVDALTKQNEALVERLDKSASEQRKKEIVAILKEEAPFAPGDVSEQAAELIELEKLSEKAAATFLNNLKATSASLEKSATFREFGSGRDNPDISTAAGQYTTALAKRREEVRKSTQEISDARVIEEVIKQQGDAAYDDYRAEHKRRVARSATGSSLSS